MLHGYGRGMSIVELAPQASTEHPHGPSRTRVGTLQLRRDAPRLRGVTVNGRHVGTIAEVLLDASLRRVLGFDVLLSGDEQCFVPLVAVRSLGPAGIELESILHVVRDVHFYRLAGEPARAVIGRPVACRHSPRGEVDDISVDLATGDVLTFELTDGAPIESAHATVADGALRVLCDCRS